jgi:arginyl-tRNA synthetase
LLKQLELFPSDSKCSAAQSGLVANPSQIYELVREHNSFHQAVSILGEQNTEKKIPEYNSLKKVADVALAFQLLGIAVPDRM